MVEAEISRDPHGFEHYALTACRTGGEADWDERWLLDAFWRYLAARPGRVAGWNSRAFDCCVILQRSLLHGLSAPAWFRTGPGREGYRYRYSSEWHADLMDLLSEHGASTKLSLDETAAACGLPGKMVARGDEVEALVAAGRIAEVRAYCEIDVLNSYALYLRYALLTGRTSRAGHDAAIDGLVRYLDRERAARLHLGQFLDRWRETAGGRDGTRPGPAPAAASGGGTPAVLGDRAA